MNAHASLSCPMTIEEAHALRSRLLDAFADAEAIVAEIARKAPKTVSEAASLSQHIQCARTVAPNPQLSKAGHKAIAEQLDHLSGLLAIRADIVHARLQFGQIDAAPAIIFRNARSMSQDHAPVRMFSSEELRHLTQQVAKIARSLRAAISPPLPPRPAPDAADDP
jgi:hypothetical protein